MKMAGLLLLPALGLAAVLGREAVLVLMGVDPGKLWGQFRNKKAALLARRCRCQTLDASVIAAARRPCDGVGSAMPGP
jgi:hypothetical protein